MPRTEKVKGSRFGDQGKRRRWGGIEGAKRKQRGRIGTDVGKAKWGYCGEKKNGRGNTEKNWGRTQRQ